MFDAIEVRRAGAPTQWYDARIEDLKDDALVCSFEDGTWETEAFAFQDVRFSSPRRSTAESKAFRPHEGDIVEYEVPKTKTSPSGWSVVKVKAREDGCKRRGGLPDGEGATFYFLGSLERNGCKRGEVIMPNTRLRPCSATSGNVAGHLQKLEVPVDPQLTDWLATAHAASHMRRAESTALRLDDSDGTPELLQVKHAGGSKASVVIIGTTKAVQRVKVLMPSILHRQMQVKVWEDAMQIRQEALEKRSANKIKAPEGRVIEEFWLDHSAVSRLLCNKGSKIQALSAEHGVRVKVGESSEGGKHRVTVQGDNQESANKFREATEVVEETFDLEAESARWALGSHHAACALIKNLSDVQEIKHDEAANALVFRGTRDACRRAVTLLRAHMSYFLKFADLDQKLEDVIGRLKEQGELGELLWPALPGLSACAKGKSGNLEEKGRAAKGRGKGKAKPS